ncbi:DUF4278 domain-containing protein [Leptolyngbya sp. FACHB-261]|uniref:DUF4278 domain-containing protein n=1 Tax=Leptolyngbya sp. FACHB-261 TaxID=2692806 RepID=UPI00168312A7|nr:DUF4278 domain-containing protein [Leptolyngbya sp. FACHB-261]MBD2103509.1 DUF4278 domain-containing protein [Leptolyngbya sp. FACHB-261]
MKLTYRGVSHDYTPPAVEPMGEGTQGKYRGLDWRFRNLRHPFVQQATLDLKYRGVAYRTGPVTPLAPEVVAPVAPVARQVAPQAEPTPALSMSVPAMAVRSAHEEARLLMMGHHRSIKNREQSLLSRSAAEVGLAADVTQFWNHIQGKVHPSFRATYDRSHAAMS